MYRWFDDHRSEKAFMIDCRYNRSKIQKSFTDGSITSMKMRPKVSIDGIDRYYRYRSIDPSPIVPIYAVEPLPGLSYSPGAPGRILDDKDNTPLLMLWTMMAITVPPCLQALSPKAQQGRRQPLPDTQTSPARDQREP